ncbi:MAG TPA: autotransporter-associated beta strand repeat-containing protein [Tepidisphaeraceae bacterium]|jgi:autotransporter-associated beta strand protein|nr:autotransporter-associated beta strand repeat-containing protein [Tepidisphaeraceae bacterium]
MKRSPRIARGVRYVAAASAGVILPHLALGGVSLSSGTYTITHDPDNLAATHNVTATGNIPVSGVMPTPGTYQYGLKTISNTGSAALASGPKTTADGSVGAITTAATVGFTFASGTGITQTDPNNSFLGQSQLRFNLNAIWTVTSGGFGPTAYGYLAFTLGGVIPPGDSAEVAISNLRWYNPDAPANTPDYRTVVTKTLDFPSLTLPYTYTNQGVFSSSPLVGSRIEVSGIIDIRAKDPGATINIAPTNFEASSAPPTWTFLNNGSMIFNDATDWDSANTDDATHTPLGPFPNGPGVRARFAGTAAPTVPKVNPIPVAINQDISLGMLDVDQQDINFAGSGVMTFANDPSNGSNCVIFVRNTHDYRADSAGHKVGVPVSLSRDTDIINDCPGPLTFLQPIGGAGGIIKSGLGPLVLSAANTFSGGITINGGSIVPTSPAAWGNNTVQVNANSQAALNGGPGNASFVVNDLGCISGAFNDLSLLSVGNSLVLPSPGQHAVIGHQTFDTGVSGNPGGLSVAPQQIFGISSNFNSAGGTESISIGDLSGGMWSGFSNDTQTRVFGSGPTSGSRSITVVGNAQLAALSSELLMNAPINGADPLNSITKLGQGLLALENVSNSYVGVMTVQSGAVAIDGVWNVNAPIPAGPLAAPLIGGSQILVSTGAALGGVGMIKCDVDVSDNAHLQPGSLTAISAPTAAAIPTTLQGSGHLSIVGNLTLHDQTQVDFDLDTPNADSDLINITGDLTLDGVLNVNDGPNFNPDAAYTLMSYTGTLTDNGLQLSSDFQNNYPLMQLFDIPGGTGGTIVLGTPLSTVPEPGTIALIGLASMIGLKRRRR